MICSDAASAIATRCDEVLKSGSSIEDLNIIAPLLCTFLLLKPYLCQVSGMWLKLCKEKHWGLRAKGWKIKFVVFVIIFWQQWPVKFILLTLSFWASIAKTHWRLRPGNGRGKRLSKKWVERKHDQGIKDALGYGKIKQQCLVVTSPESCWNHISWNILFACSIFINFFTQWWCMIPYDVCAWLML